MAQVRPISPIEALHNWGRIEPLIQRVYEVMEVGKTIDEIVTEIQLDTMQVWVVGDYQAIGITQLLEKPKPHVFIFIVAGDGVHEWFPDLMGTIEAAGREVGAKYIDCCARAGWTKVSKPLGFSEVFRVLRKEISDGQGE